MLAGYERFVNDVEQTRARTGREGHSSLLRITGILGETHLKRQPYLPSEVGFPKERQNVQRSSGLLSDSPQD